MDPHDLPDTATAGGDAPRATDGQAAEPREADLYPWSPWTQGATATLGSPVDADAESDSMANHILALYLGFCS